MRTQFLQVATRAEAVKIAPWAAIIRKCDGGYIAGGYIAYECVSDARIAKNQK